jgi:Domain of unknown function (DUF5615)
LRLLLDDMYSPQIAQNLRDRGRDVEAVQEREELKGVDDEPLLTAATAEGRALLTNNVADFAPLTQRFATEGMRHSGVIFTNDGSLPRRLNTIGLYLDEIDRVMGRRPQDDAMADLIAWLPEKSR